MAKKKNCAGGIKLLRIVERVARTHGFDPRLIEAQIWAESNWDPAAVSHCGAMGLMQLMPATAEEVAGELFGVIIIIVDSAVNHTAESSAGDQQSQNQDRHNQTISLPKHGNSPVTSSINRIFYVSPDRPTRASGDREYARPDPRI